MLAVLKLGANADDQANVKRPRTATLKNLQQMQNQLAQITEEFDREPHLSEQSDIDIEERQFAFSLRNVARNKLSSSNMENKKTQLLRESSASQQSIRGNNHESTTPGRKTSVASISRKQSH